jgi:hypothetical protein
MTDIDAIVMAGDRIDDRLREIAENVFRVELTVLERSELVEEWTRLIREKVGQVAHPGGLQPNRLFTNILDLDLNGRRCTFPGRENLYQFALLATHVRRCRGFVTPIQALDSTRIYKAIIPAQRWAP